MTFMNTIKEKLQKKKKKNVNKIKHKHFWIGIND